MVGTSGNILKKLADLDPLAAAEPGCAFHIMDKVWGHVKCTKLIDGGLRDNDAELEVMAPRGNARRERESFFQ
jgi:hypothetical protein